MKHIPVLQKEVLEYVDPGPNQNFIDATIGSGGHSLAILEKNCPQGKLLGIDLDEKALSNLAERIRNTEIEKRLILVCGNFADLEEIVKKNNFGPVQGIVADLGLSSMELEERGRGFSFLKDEPLIMRYAHNNFQFPISNFQNLTAAEIVNEWNEENLVKIFQEYGEEKFSRQIAREIVRTRKARPIKTTFQLVEIIKSSTPAWYHHRRLHPATKIFQALRIIVNDELGNLNKFLPQTLEIIGIGGRLAIISFHSLEDRLVKKFFRDSAKNGAIKILTKKAIKPSPHEIVANPRSRSAILRAAQKI